MSRRAPEDIGPPLDKRLDRRAFLGRMAALSAAASTGALGRPVRLDAAPTAGGTDVAGTPLSELQEPLSVSAPPPEPWIFEGDVRAAALRDPTEATVMEAARMIRERRFTRVDLVEAYLERIERLDGLYMAYNEVPAAAALERAQVLHERPGRHPLNGIPLAIKDNFYTAGVRTTANSLIFQGFVPGFDATAVARLKAAGAIMLGKTQMGPLATTRATSPAGEVTTVNAWFPETPRISPGGSSSGSATAVAARLAPSSTGTQTGGSITVPSIAQGLTGLKPTLGVVSLYGVIPLTYTRDHVGPISRDALDAAVMLQTMGGPDPNDARTQGLPQMPNLIRAVRPVERRGRVQLRWNTTIGVPPGYASGDDAIARAQARMLRTFDRLGARIEEVRLPDEWDELGTGAFNNVRLPERSEPFLDYLKQDVRLFGVSLSSWINGLLLSGDEYLKGQRARFLLLQRVLDQVFDQCDVLAQPSHLPFDMLGLPLIAFPIGMREYALRERPVGAILAGQPFAEDRLLSLVGAYQAVTEWHLRRPPEPRDGQAKAAPTEKRFARGRIRAEDVMELTE